MVDEITLVISISALVISIAGIVPLYLDYFTRRAERTRFDMEVERFQTFSAIPPENGWGIRVLNPSKIIEHCSAEVVYGSGLRVTLRIQDMSIFETKVPMRGRASFLVPKGIVPEGTVIVVRDGTKEILRRNAQQIPLVNP